MDPIITVKNIYKNYGATHALEDISFNVKENELFGFIGPDGAGKTSLLRILTTLLIPDKGEARVCGLNTINDYRQIRLLLGYMPGRFSLYQDLTVEENLTFFASVFNTTIAENYDLIKDIYSHIEPFKDRPAGKLSGGMKQKLALSCALIHKPTVLILDEPTTGVDAVSRKEFWQMLKNLQQRGITILVSTPYMDEAGMCDRVALIQKGRIMQIDKPAEIVKSYPKQLLSIRSKELYPLLRDLREYPDTGSVFPFGQELHYTSKNTTIDTNPMRKYLEEKGHKEINISSIQPGIEDVFMELMKENENRK